MKAPTPLGSQGGGGGGGGGGGLGGEGGQLSTVQHAAGQCHILIKCPASSEMRQTDVPHF